MNGYEHTKKLQKLLDNAKLSKNRTSQGAILFESVIMTYERAAKDGKRSAVYPDHGFINGTSNVNTKIATDPFTLPPLEFELYNRLIEADLKVVLSYNSYVDYGGGAYCEDITKSGLYLRIEW